MSWRLEGSYFENCNCDVLCPCGASFFALPADNERCLVVLVFHVDSGEIDGLDVSGLSWAIVADTPGRMIDGGWRVGVIMDENASAEQSEALVAVAGGQRGGPPAMFASFMGEMLGVQTAPIEYTNDGTRHSVKIDGVGEIEIEDFLPEGQSEPIKLTNVPHPANTTLTAARATRSGIDVFGLEIDNTGKNGHYAPISWAA